MRAVLPSSAFQITTYVYGVTSGGGSNINSNDILAEVDYPTVSGSSQDESFTVDALGEKTSYTDRNGNEHDYSCDVLGRMTSDVVATLGSGVNGSVRRVNYTFTPAGQT